MFKPRVDPCIFLHYQPEDWEELLGEDMARELLRRWRHVARDIDELVDYFRENNSVAHIGLRGMRIGGKYREEWIVFAEGGYVSPALRTKWPPAQPVGKIEVRLQVSPCYLLTSLTSYDRVYIWRNRASSLFKWVEDIPRAKALEVFRSAFPSDLRDLGRTAGYASVANSRWRDRKAGHLAEWLYWLDTGRLPHIDMALGRLKDMCIKADCTKLTAAESLYETA